MNRPLIPASHRQRRLFRFVIAGSEHFATAMTRSEARAKIKKRLNLKRLPVGA